MTSQVSAPPAEPALLRVPYWFLRHGETDWNASGKTQGRTDVALNASGLAQAEAASVKLRAVGIATIVTSTLGRAVRTAEIVGAALGLEVRTDAGLCEANFGDQEGQTMGPWYDRWVRGEYTPEGGESFALLRERAVLAANRALAQPGPILIVAHGGLFRALRAAMGHTPTLRTANGVPIHCVPGEPAWSLDALGQAEAA